MKIYVAGHNGLVGSAIIREIERTGRHQWIGRPRPELNLFDKEKIKSFLLSEKPDAIIIAAAKVGGIKANETYPVEFLLENLEIQNNLISCAHEENIDKLVFLGSSCIYPRNSRQPIKEEYLLSGPLEATNEAYAIAKIAGLKLVQAYRKEYKKTWISVMPTNIYGPGDNFEPNTSHVLPALIRKFHEAKSNNHEFVELWGTGEPKREFLHADDLANAILFLLENYSGDLPINIGSGDEVKISELASIIAKVTKFQGDIIWNSEMPDGTPRKLLDSSRLLELGWGKKIDLMSGIESTYSWFLDNEASIQANQQ